MYTSCPECGTVFRISTIDLRAAEGYVRCGHCSATFNAVATLTDEPPATVTVRQFDLPTEPEPAHEPPLQPTVGPANEPIDEPSVEHEPLPVSDDTLEFDIPEDSWSNFFEAGVPAAAVPVPKPEPAPVPEKPEPDTPDGIEIETEAKTESEPGTEPDFDVAMGDDDEPSGTPAAPAATDVGASVGSDTVDQAGLYRALSAETGLKLDDDADWQALLEEVRDDDAAPEPVYVISEKDQQGPPDDLPLPGVAWDEPPAGDTLSPAPLPADFAPDLRGSGPGDDPEREAAPHPVTVADRPFVWEPPAPPPASSRPHWGYTVGSALAALLLVMQLLHQQRDSLATNPSLTEPLRQLYAALGMPLWPAWDLRAYELRTSEAVADRSSPGALDILGRIAVVGNERVGLPLVRVTLRDRFGESLGSRVFEPAQYLGQNAPPREPVSPGTLIPVEISLKDPGRDAQGFDVDVCLMSRRDGITCRSDREPFAR